MDKRTFRTNLHGAAKLLLQVSRNYCYNHLSDNCLFTITPNVRIADSHLNAEEIKLLEKLNKLEGREFTIDAMVDLLYHNNKVPLWINMCVQESRDGATIVHLYTSRRLRTEGEINACGENQFPPFKPCVIQPPDFLRSADGAYDINWTRQYQQMMMPKGLFQKIKRFFGDGNSKLTDNNYVL